MKKILLLATILSGLTAHTVAGESCHELVWDIEDVKQERRDVSWERHLLSLEVQKASDKIESLEKEYNRASRLLKQSKSELAAINYTYNNSDKEIEKYASELANAKSKLDRATKNEQRLLKKYNSISSSIWKVFKKRKARKAWQAAKAETSAKLKIVQNISIKLTWIDNVVNNYAIVADQALVKVQAAEESFFKVEKNESLILKLKKSKVDMRHKDNRLYSKETRLESKIRRLKERLADCRKEE